MGIESVFLNVDKGSGEREAVEKAILHRKEVQERAQEKGINVKDFGIIDEEITKLKVKRDRLLQDLRLSPDSPAIQELEVKIKRLKQERGDGMNRKIETVN
jgi:hypothetical protein